MITSFSVRVESSPTPWQRGITGPILIKGPYSFLRDLATFLLVTLAYLYEGLTLWAIHIFFTCSWSSFVHSSSESSSCWNSSHQLTVFLTRYTWLKAPLSTIFKFQLTVPCTSWWFHVRYTRRDSSLASIFLAQNWD